MRTLVVYDSGFGNTEKIAKEVAKTLDGKVKKVSDFSKSDLEGIGLFIVGSPINGWRPMPSVVELLNSLGGDDLKGIKATSFDTRVKLFIHGDAKDKIAKQLERAGAEIVVKPEAFYVKGQNGPLFEGEEKKAIEWAKSIKKYS